MLFLLCPILLLPPPSADAELAALPKAHAEALLRLKEALGPFIVDVVVTVRKPEFDDAALAKLAPAVARLRAVRRLDLTRTRVTPAGLKAAFPSESSLYSVAAPKSLERKLEMQETLKSAYAGFYLFPVAFDPDGAIAFSSPLLVGGAEGARSRESKLEPWTSAGFSAEDKQAFAEIEKAGGELRLRCSFAAKTKAFTDADLIKLLPALRALPDGCLELSLQESGVTAAGLKRLIGVKSLGRLVLSAALDGEKQIIGDLRLANRQLSIAGAFAAAGDPLPGVVRPSDSVPQGSKPQGSKPQGSKPQGSKAQGSGPASSKPSQD